MYYIIYTVNYFFLAVHDFFVGTDAQSTGVPSIGLPM